MTGNGNGNVRMSTVFWLLGAIGTGVVVVVTAVAGMLSTHSTQPHVGAVRTDEYDRDVRQIRDDMREIREMIRDLDDEED